MLGAEGHQGLRFCLDQQGDRLRGKRKLWLGLVGSDTEDGENWVYFTSWWRVGAEHLVPSGLTDAQRTTLLWGALPGTRVEEEPVSIWVLMVPAGLGWENGWERWDWGTLSTYCRGLGCVLNPVRRT